MPKWILVLLLVLVLVPVVFGQEAPCYAPVRDGELGNGAHCVEEYMVELVALTGMTDEIIREHVYYPGPGLEEKSANIWACTALNTEPAGEFEAVAIFMACFMFHAGPPLDGSSDNNGCNPDFVNEFEDFDEDDLVSVQVTILNAAGGSAYFEYTGEPEVSGLDGEFFVSSDEFSMGYTHVEGSASINVRLTCKTGEVFTHSYDPTDPSNWEWQDSQ
jgi:hypothetical protein